MRYFPRTVVLVVLFFAHSLMSAQNQTSPWKIEATGPDGNIKYDLKTGSVSAANGVKVTYKKGEPNAAEMTAQKALLHQNTGLVIASGNVVLRREGQTWKTEELEYNFKTKQIKATSFRGGNLKYYVKGEDLQGAQTNGAFTARNVVYTLDDTPNPDYYILAKRVEISPGKKIKFHGASLHVGKLPVAYLPYYERNLGRHPWNTHIELGNRSNWGTFLLTSTRWPATDKFGGEMDIDYRSKRGFALGPDVFWDYGKWGKGDLESYFAFDDDPMNDSNGNPLNSKRQRFRFSHRADWGQSTSALGVMNFESDEYMRRDFFEHEYRRNVQPKTFLELNHDYDNYNLNLLTQARINDHFGTIERLPDLRFSGLRQQLGKSDFYYDMETSLSHFRRKYSNDGNPWFGGQRFDTIHQVYMPNNYFGWLNVTPRIGGRLTHYSETEGPGSTLGTADRFVLNTGVELSAKASRLYAGADSKLFELNGLRHIIEPSLNYVYVPRPNEKPNELPQYDYEVTSARLLPIMYPEYNAIDAIDGQNVLRMGLRNRLQTRRKNQLDEFFDWAIYTDWRLNPLSGQQDFAGLFNDISFRPRSWITLGSNLRYDVDEGMWRLINNSITFAPLSKWAVSLGNFYYLEPGKTSKADRDSVAYTSLAYRFNEEWSFSTRHYYDTKRGRMSDHSYTLYRDFRSWVGYLNLRFVDSEGSSREDDFQISLNFSLKTYPRAPSY